MLLSDLYTDLSFGELSNLSWAQNTGAIDEAFQPKLVRYANAGLLRLYSRFIIKTDDVLIRMFEHITNYQLLPRFALTTTPAVEDYVYIIDTPLEPFDDVVIKILNVFDSLGRELPLNNSSEYWSVFTPQPKILQVPHPIKWNSLSVTYQARHVPLDVATPDQPIEVPDCLYDALKAYVAYKTFSDMDTETSTAKAQEHMANYENICTEVEAGDLVNMSISSTSTVFHARGFV